MEVVQAVHQVVEAVQVVHQVVEVPHGNHVSLVVETVHQVVEAAHLIQDGVQDVSLQRTIQIS